MKLWYGLPGEGVEFPSLGALTVKETSLGDISSIRPALALHLSWLPGPDPTEVHQDGTQLSTGTAAGREGHSVPALLADQQAKKIKVE